MKNKLENMCTDSIKLQILFPLTYPSQPPQIQLISPRIKDSNGFVNKGGTFCLEDLSNNCWAPGGKENQVFCLLLKIWSFMQEDNIQFEKGSHTFEEGEIEFNKMRDSLGWK